MRVTSIHSASSQTSSPLPLFLVGVSAGFPSPADDYIEKQLDLNEHIIKHPSSTFFVRVEGDSMKDANISSGDILVIDRSIEPSNGKIVVAIINGEFTVKRLLKTPAGIYLQPENPKYPSFLVPSESDFQVWGVVTYVIHRAK